METKLRMHLVVGGYLIYNAKVLLIHHKKLKAWLPVGGHIDENETPDKAVKREFKEEVNLDVRILNNSMIKNSGKVKKRLAIPIDVHVHNVGNHDHCCFFYLCESGNISKLRINKNEVDDYEWFSPSDLKQRRIHADVRNIALEAFRIFNSKK